VARDELVINKDRTNLSLFYNEHQVYSVPCPMELRHLVRHKRKDAFTTCDRIDFFKMLADHSFHYLYHDVDKPPDEALRVIHRPDIITGKVK